ncbi:MAG TPA: ROK family protein [Rhizomicrobium sp.]
MAAPVKSSATSRSVRVLSIDIGGNGLKAALVDLHGKLLTQRVRIPTPYPCPPAVMIDSIAELVAPLPKHQRIAAAFPGVVRGGDVVTAPHFGTKDWAGFDLSRSLSQRLGGRCLLINDAEMHGLAAVRGKGIELMLTLGTGAGTGLFRDGAIMPHLELAHHPVHKDKSYNDYVGERALKTAGKKRWNRRVEKVIAILYSLLNFDHLYIGGGNSCQITFELPPAVTLVTNDAGIVGGGILWQRMTRAA